MMEPENSAPVIRLEENETSSKVGDHATNGIPGLVMITVGRIRSLLHVNIFLERKEVRRHLQIATK